VPTTDARPTTPAEAWEAMQAGNARFVRGEVLHPDQDAARRAELAADQRPFALLFGCGDSRVAAEIIFDRGLGDLFVVRTAGHVVDTSVMGSVEFAVSQLSVPLIVVLGHDRCGAVRATIDALDSGVMPGGYLRDLVERVTPSVVSARARGTDDLDEIEAEHVRQTGRLLHDRSTLVSEKVRRGELAIVGTVYDLADGRVNPTEVIGEIDSPSI
jgi:carbonic anhydrase